MKPSRQIIALLFASIVGFVIFSCLGMALSNMGIDTNAPDAIRAIQGLGSLMIFLAPALAVVAYSREPLGTFYKMRFSPGTPYRMLCGSVAILLLTPLNDVLIRWNGGLHFPEAMQAFEHSLREMAATSQAATEHLLAVNDFWHISYNLLILAVLPAICEEFFFRGALLKILHRWCRNPHVAILITAAIFSLAHGDIFNFLPRFVLGATLGYLYFGTHNMLINITAHFVNNAAVVILYALYHNGNIPFSPIEMPSIGWLGTLLATMGAILMLYQTHRAAFCPINPNRSLEV